MGIVGGRAAAGALVLLAALAGCAGAPDVARTIESEVDQLDRVADVAVTAPTDDRAATLTVTYDDGTDAAGLAALLAELTDLADEDYPTYRLNLVPELEPDSALVVGPGFTGGGTERAVLDAWLLETSALLGPVRHVVDPGGEQITVDSGGGVAQDLGEARRMRYGDTTTTWVFRAGAGTFTADGRVTAGDLALVQAVQRSAGVEGQPAWVDSWWLDRRAGHVRLDLEVALDGSPAPGAQVTAARHGAALGPLVDAALSALAATELPVWLRLLDGPGDVLAAWSSERRSAPGRDPLDRGWDAWLASRAVG